MLMTKKTKMNKENQKQENDSENEFIEIPISDSAENPEEQDQENYIEGPESNLQKQNSLLKDQLLRKAAEFENYKRRTENEISSLFKYANEGLILELLPVLDDFDRVNNSWNEKHDAETFKKGIELVYDKFNKVLKKQGLKEIDSKGKQFDVNKHEAIMQTPNAELEPNTIVDVAEKGYDLKDKVLRHAKVIVSSKPE